MERNGSLKVRKRKRHKKKVQIGNVKRTIKRKKKRKQRKGPLPNKKRVRGH